MKKKIYTRPVSVVLSQETFDQIQEITDREDIAISDYIRDAIQEKLNETKNNNNKKGDFKNE
jgi:metal-responsive CopG/Arc/MetJ family transcriptional regulator